MEVGATKANSWICEEINGWAERPTTFLHYKCGRYFTTLKEVHKCYHWSREFSKTQKKWDKEAGKWIKLGKKKETERSLTNR